MSTSNDLTITLFALDNAALPDYETLIDQCTPLIVGDDGRATVQDSGGIRQVDFAYFEEAVKAGKRFVCFDGVEVHRQLLGAAKTNKKKQRCIWSLTDSYSLWDIGILEQRIVWATEGRAVPFPDIPSLFGKYGVSIGDQHKCLRDILRCQFRYLVEHLPYLKNDISGRHVFPQSDSPLPNTHLTQPDTQYEVYLHTFLPIIHGWRKFGPASVGIDLQGAIAADYQFHRSQEFTLTAGEKVIWKARLQSILHSFGETPSLTDCFDLKSGKLTPDGAPIYQNEAPEIIQKLAEELNSPQSLPSGRKTPRQYRRFPQATKDTLKPDHWNGTLPPSGPLQTWADYHNAVQTGYYLKTAKWISQRSMPFFETSLSDFCVRTFGRIPLLPKPGHCHIRIDLSDLAMMGYLIGSIALYDKTIYHYDPTLHPILGPHIRVVPPRTDADGNRTPAKMESVPARDLEFVPRQYRQTWTRTVLSHPSLFFHANPRIRRFFYTIISGVLFPEMREAKNDFDEETVALLQSRTNSIIRNWMQSTDETELPFEESVAALPGWLRRNDLYLDLAEFVVHGCIRGHRAGDMTKAIRDRHTRAIGKHIENLTTLVSQMSDWLTLRTIHWQYDSFYYPVMFAAKCGDKLWLRQLEDDNHGNIYWEFFTPHGKRSLRSTLETQASIRTILDETQTHRMETDERLSHLEGTTFLSFIRRSLEAMGVSREEFFNFFYETNALSLTGKPGRPVDVLNKQFFTGLEVSDDVMKSVAYALVRCGADIVAYGSNFIILDVVDDETTQRQVQEYQSTVEDALNNIFGFVEEYCRIRSPETTSLLQNTVTICILPDPS